MPLMLHVVVLAALSIIRLTIKFCVDLQYVNVEVSLKQIGKYVDDISNFLVFVIIILNKHIILTDSVDATITFSMFDATEPLNWESRLVYVWVTAR